MQSKAVLQPAASGARESSEESTSSVEAFTRAFIDPGAQGSTTIALMKMLEGRRIEIERIQKIASSPTRTGLYPSMVIIDDLDGVEGRIVNWWRNEVQGFAKPEDQATYRGLRKQGLDSAAAIETMKLMGIEAELVDRFGQGKGHREPKKKLPHYMGRRRF